MACLALDTRHTHFRPAWIGGIAMNEEGVQGTLLEWYAGIHDQAAWARGLANLCNTCDAAVAAVVTFDRDSGRSRIHEMHASDQARADNCNDAFEAMASAWPFLETLAPGDWSIDTRDVGTSSTERLPSAYREYLQRFGLASVMAGMLSRDAYSHTCLMLLRPLGVPPFQADNARRLDWLMPHLRGIVDLRRRVLEASQAAHVLSALLERFSFGLAVVTREGKVLLSNGRGEVWTRRLWPARQLAAPEQAAGPAWRVSRPLNNMLAAACEPGAAAAVQAAHMHNGHGQEARLVMLPMPPTHHLARLSQAPAAIVIVHDSQSPPILLTGVLRQLYRLTDAETRLAATLAGGRGLPDACQELGIRHETARSQLKSIFDKTATGSQAKLAHLLTQLSTSLSAVPPSFPPEPADASSDRAAQESTLSAALATPC